MRLVDVCIPSRWVDDSHCGKRVGSSIRRLFVAMVVLRGADGIKMGKINERDMRLKHAAVASGVPTTEPTVLRVYQLAKFNKTADSTPCTLTVADGNAHLVRDDGTILLHAPLCELSAKVVLTSKPFTRVTHKQTKLKIAAVPRHEFEKAVVGLHYTSPELMRLRADEANRIFLALQGLTPIQH